MRNLKRALSLTLASVMLLGMMVMGTSAASFPDVDDNDNVEAIAVLKATGVMIGDNGNFKPDAPVTRNEMAVIMTNMLGLNANDFAGACPFTDVAGWAQNYVAACYANGIIAGRSATVFDGQATVTATEAAAMMMRALGYFQYPEDYSTNGGFTSATVKQAAKIRLFDGVAGAANTPMVRNDVAQLALNTLEADVVDFTGNVGWEINGIKSGFRSEYSPRVDGYTNGGYDYTEDNSPATNKTHQQEYLQLLEDLYDGKLRYKANGSTGVTEDDMRHPGHTWIYKGDEIIFVADEADYTYVVEKLGTTNNKVDSYVTEVLKETKWTYGATPVSINGATPVAESAGTLAIGDTVEIYMSDSTPNQIDKIIVTHPQVFTLTGDADSKVDGKDTQVKVPGVVGLGGFTSSKTTENVVGWEGLKKDDVVLVYVDKGGAADGTTHISLADSISGVVTGKKDGTKLIIDGKTYGNSGLPNATNAWSENYTDEYTFYLDASGSIVKAVKNTDKAPDQYAFVLESSWVTGSGDLTVKNTAQARLVLADGTTEVVTVSKIDGADTTSSNRNGADGKFVTYKVSDGKYELTTKDTTSASGAIAGGKVVFATSQAGNNNTVFLVNTKTGGKANSEPEIKLYTGISELPSISATTTIKVYEDGGLAKYVYINADSANVQGSDGQYIYIPGTGDNYNKLSYTYVPETSSGKGDQYYLFDAIVNGKSEQIKIKSLTNITGTAAGGTYTGSLGDGQTNTVFKVNGTNADGVITKLEATPSATTGAEFKDGVLITTGVKYKVTSSTEVYRISKNGAVTEMSALTNWKDTTDGLYVIKDSDDHKTADRVIIKEIDSSTAGITGYTITVDGVDYYMSDTKTSGTSTTTVIPAAKEGATAAITSVDCYMGSWSVDKTVPVGANGTTNTANQITLTVTAEDGTGPATITVQVVANAAPAPQINVTNNIGTVTGFTVNAPTEADQNSSFNVTFTPASNNETPSLIELNGQKVIYKGDKQAVTVAITTTTSDVTLNAPTVTTLYTVPAEVTVTGTTAETKLSVSVTDTALAGVDSSAGYVTADGTVTLTGTIADSEKTATLSITPTGCSLDGGGDVSHNTGTATSVSKATAGKITGNISFTAAFA